jgi:SUKH-3 immunity protein
MTRIAATIEPYFLLAGRRHTRKIEVTPPVPLDHPSAAILAEIGGLSVGQTGRGEECATSDVVFRPLHPDNSILGVWNELLRTQLIGVAEVHDGHGELYVDSSGLWFEASLMDDS